MRFFRIEVPLFVALMVSWVHSQDCGDVMLSGSGVFTSPNYPKEYGHKHNCSWTITASLSNFVRLTFVEFDLKSPFIKCEHDYVTVDDGTGNTEVFCNNKRPLGAIKSVGTVMKVTLNTDDFFRNGKGFKAAYDIVDKDGNSLNKEDKEEDEDVMTDAVMTSTRSKSSPKQSTKTTLETSTVLLAKLVKTSTIAPHTSTSVISNNNEGQSGDPGKTSGVVIGVIVVFIVAVISIICAIAFSRYRKNKNKRISLSVIVTPDDKELISNGKIYKKIGNKTVEDPEAETFPL